MRVVSLAMTGAVPPTLHSALGFRTHGGPGEEERSRLVCYFAAPVTNECWRASEPGTECRVAVCRNWVSNRMHMHTLGTLLPPG